MQIRTDAISPARLCGLPCGIAWGRFQHVWAGFRHTSLSGGSTAQGLIIIIGGFHYVTLIVQKYLFSRTLAAGTPNVLCGCDSLIVTITIFYLVVSTYIYSLGVAVAMAAGTNGTGTFCVWSR